MGSLLERYATFSDHFDHLLFKIDGKKEVLVIYCYDDKIGVYEILENGDLKFTRTIASSPTMDNFWNAPDGSIYLAGSKHAWRFFWNKFFPSK